MSWPAMLFSLVLAPAVVLQPLPVSQTGTNATEQTVVLRACVERGTHGSLANLNQVEVVTAGGDISQPGRIMFWFYKNLADFPAQVGHLVEVTGTITDVLAGNTELKATDGVFGEGQVGSSPKAAGTSGATTNQPTGTTGGVGANEAENLPASVVKAAVTRLRMVGSCGP